MCTPQDTHGHNYAGGVCVECGKYQVEAPKKVDYGFKKPELKKPVHGMHSSLHALVKDLTEYFGEQKKFGMYLGLVRGQEQKAREVWSRMRQNGINSGRYFFAAMRKGNGYSQKKI